MKLPKPYLSYSALKAFLTTSTRRNWILRYIYKQPFFTSKEMIFGRRVSEALEEENYFKIDSDLIDMVTKVKVDIPSEVPLVLQQKGFHIIGYCDGCSEDYKKVVEYKTGKTEWTQEKVNNHYQLDTYSLMIYEAFGIIPECTLIWMETKDADVPGGIDFTGRVETYNRTCTIEEIQEIKETFNTSFVEMAHIYKKYLDGYSFEDAKEARVLIKEIQDDLKGKFIESFESRLINVPTISSHPVSIPNNAFSS